MRMATILAVAWFSASERQAGVNVLLARMAVRRLPAPLRVGSPVTHPARASTLVLLRRSRQLRDRCRGSNDGDERAVRTSWLAT